MSPQRIPKHDHLLPARPAGEMLKHMQKQARRGRVADRGLVNSQMQPQILDELNKQVSDVQKQFDEQKVGQRRYVVDANGFGTHITIQEAVNEAVFAAMAADPTAVIFINPGTYTENITADFSGSALTALSFQAEGVHGSASDLVFPSELATETTFVASVVIQPETAASPTLTFTGDAGESVFVSFQGIKIGGNLNVVDSGLFTAKVRLLDSMIDHDTSDDVFSIASALASPNVLLVRSLIVAPDAALFAVGENFTLFGTFSRLAVKHIEDGIHSGAADPFNPFLGSIAALQTCHLELGASGFQGEYLFWLLLNSTISLLDGGNSLLFNGVAKANLGLINDVIVDDKQARSIPVVQVSGSIGLISGVNFYGRGDVDPADPTPEGTAIYLASSTASTMNIVNNRFIGYAKGIECQTVDSLEPGSIIGPNTFNEGIGGVASVTTPLTNIDPRYNFQWPLMKSVCLVPRPVALLQNAVAFVAVQLATIFALVGRVHLESPIEPTKFTYNIFGAGSVNAQLRIALYSADGQIKHFDEVDISGALTGDRTVTISPLTGGGSPPVLPAGDYYVFICLKTGTTAPSVLCYDTLLVLAAPTASEPDLEAAHIITGGAAPATIDPTALSSPAGDRTLIFRLDGNVS